MVSKMVVPVTAKSDNIQNEMNDPFTAIDRLIAVDRPTVRPRNIGALPIGSVITNSVTNAFKRVSMVGNTIHLMSILSSTALAKETVSELLVVSRRYQHPTH